MSENHKVQSLASLKRREVALKRAIKHQEAICIAAAHIKTLERVLEDLIDFNAGRIGGTPEDYCPKLKKEPERKKKQSANGSSEPSIVSITRPWV